MGRSRPCRDRILPVRRTAHRPLPASIRRALALLAVLPPLAGCSLFTALPVTRGDTVTADQLHELIPGTSTRADATSLLGSPTAHATFDDNTWIYIGQRTRARVGQVPGIDNQDVVVLTFDQAGTLRDVRHLTKRDGVPVDMVARATPSPGSEASFLQQLLGNIGRYSPGGLGATNTSGGSSAGGGTNTAP